MMINVVVRDVDEIKLLCLWCKVIIMYEVIISYVNTQNQVLEKKLANHFVKF